MENKACGVIDLDEQYREAYLLHNKYVANLVGFILFEIGALDEILTKEFDLPSLMKKLKIVESSRISFEWLVNFYIQSSVDIKNIANEDIFEEVMHKLKSQILQVDASFDVAIEMIDYVARNYRDFLIGAKTGVEIIFSGQGLLRWKKYFNNDFSGYGIFNRAGANEIHRVLNRYQFAKIIELGSGCCSASEMVLESLSKDNSVEKLSEYMVTDIAPIFLKSSCKRLKFKYPGINIRNSLVDFNLEISSQTISLNSVDVIYAVNALHAAKDLEKSLKYILDVLKPGGTLVLSELARNSKKSLLAQEFIFNLLESYTQINLNDNYRFSCGFLTLHDWKEVLLSVGFRNIQVGTNKTYTEFNHEIVGVITGEKEIN